MRKMTNKDTQKMITPHAEGAYIFPRDKAAFAGVFWRIEEAARAWGVPYHTARRWALLHPDSAVWVMVKCRGSKRGRWKLCIWKHAEKEPSRSVGNPLFRTSKFQRQMAARSVAAKRAGRVLQ